MNPIAQEILNFWFGKKPFSFKPNWFQKNPAFDEEIRTKYLEAYKRAANQEFETWQNDANTLLALIIILDQFPRNLFRDTPQSFATDNHALAHAKTAVAKGYDQKVDPVQRMFFYLPFEHSETKHDQKMSINLFGALRAETKADEVYNYAQKHFEIIQKFGRFPHRNKILGRVSTPAEEEFLKNFKGF